MTLDFCLVPLAVTGIGGLCALHIAGMRALGLLYWVSS